MPSKQDSDSPEVLFYAIVGVVATFTYAMIAFMIYISTRPSELIEVQGRVTAIETRWEDSDSEAKLEFVVTAVTFDNSRVVEIYLQDVLEYKHTHGIEMEVGKRYVVSLSRSGLPSWQRPTSIIYIKAQDG